MAGSPAQEFVEGFEDLLPYETVQRARDLAAHGFVTLSSVRGRELLATVGKPAERRVVSVDVTSEFDFSGKCSCPLSGSEICEHQWATILYAYASGLLRIPGVGHPTDHLRLLAGEAEGSDRIEFESDLARGQPPARTKPEDPIQLLNRVGRIEALDLWEDLKGGREHIVYVLHLDRALRDGSLFVELKRRSRKANGEWGGARAYSVDRSKIEDLPDDDREIMSLLLGAESTRTWYGDRAGGAEFELAERGARVVVEMMCATGRAHVFRDGEIADQPLAWTDGEWVIGLEISEHDGVARLDGFLQCGEERRSLDDFALIRGASIAIAEGRAAAADLRGTLGLAAVLKRRGGIEVPAARLEELVRAVVELPGNAAVTLPPPWTQAASIAPTPGVLAMTPQRTGPLVCHLVFDYDGTEVSSSSPQRLVRTDANCVVWRDPEAERAAAETLVGLGFRPCRTWSQDDPPLTVPAKRFARVVRQLLADGWRVLADGKGLRRPGSFQLSVASGEDWFELRGGVEFDGELVPMPQILAAVRKGQDVVQLGDGSTGLLPEDWLRRALLLLKLGKKGDDDHLRFARGQSWVLDALLASMPDVDVDEGFAKARQALTSFKGVVDRTEPATFEGSLRSYQRRGLGWFAYLRDFGFGGCLADDMGLGKTVQVLALLEERRLDRPGPTLAVVPKSLIFNWCDEAARFAPQISVVDYTGNKRRERFEDILEADLVLTTYGVLRRDILDLKEIAFDYVILDEAHLVKNASTQAAKATRLLQSEHRLTLTGTPIENRLDDLWSMFEFLNPGMLGTASVFKSLTQKGAADGHGRQLVSQAVRPFLLRRTKQEVIQDLPAKTEQVLWCEMEAAQARHYRQIRDYYRSSLLTRVEDEGLEKSKIHVLEALLRLRQVACHPGLVDEKHKAEESAKIEVLLPRLLEVAREGHKALVFSQFTKLLRIAGDALDAAGLTYEYLDGRTRKRQEKVDRFQTDPNCPVFLVSLKVGGVGLNLTAASYVFLLDPWWNPAVEAQAIDRTHRIGQTKPVFAYRLICKDTVEEKILALQASKRELASAVIDADTDMLRTLTAADLKVLLS